MSAVNQFTFDAASTSRARESVLAGDSSVAIELGRAVERAVDARTVVVRGPAGSGRRQIARALHRLRCEQGIVAATNAPFVEVRCGALSGTWGIERLLGTKALPGLLEAARGGTLALVGAESLDDELQGLLAEALGRGSFVPLGARAPRRLDLCLVAVTCDEELDRLLGPELAYRLNDRCIEVPSLALRRTDLAAIAAAILEGRGAPALARSAADALVAEPWIGGLDELAELLERAAADANGAPIEARHLGQRHRGAVGEFAASVQSESLPIGDRSWRSVEKALIARVLEESAGNRSRAARVLGFNRSTLYHKLAQYGLA